MRKRYNRSVVRQLFYLTRACGPTTERRIGLRTIVLQTSAQLQQHWAVPLVLSGDQPWPSHVCSTLPRPRQTLRACSHLQAVGAPAPARVCDPAAQRCTCRQLLASGSAPRPLFRPWTPCHAAGHPNLHGPIVRRMPQAISQKLISHSQAVLPGREALAPACDDFDAISPQQRRLFWPCR